jgi:hypothetical protein
MCCVRYYSKTKPKDSFAETEIFLKGDFAILESCCVRCYVYQNGSLNWFRC